MVISILRVNYNIPRKIRELQCMSRGAQGAFDYNIPRKIRELQFVMVISILRVNYNIPRKIRELQSFQC